MVDQRVVRLRYTTRDGRTSRRDVEPILFASTNGRWYLVGWCRLRTDIRWFRVDAIEAAQVTALQCADHSITDVGVPPASAGPVHGTPD